MTTRCKPGDIAVLVEDPNFKGRDVGAFVDVLEMCEIHEGGVVWRCRARGRRLAVFHCLFGRFEIPHRSREADIPDAWLRPIRPPGIAGTTHTKADKPLKEHA